jgi:hypothetical protein
LEIHKKIIVLGSGNSGSGAVYDYLVGRRDISKPLDKEFRLIQDPGGLTDLHDVYSLGYDPERASETINDFIDFCNRCGRSNRLFGYYFNARYGNGYALLLDNYFQKVCDFLGSITERVDGENEGSGAALPFVRTAREKVAEFRRRVNGKELQQGSFLPAVDEAEFLKQCERFLNELFPMKNWEKNPQAGVAIDQGGSFWAPESSTVYYGKNRKVVVVSRDPRGVYNSFKTKGLAYPGNYVELFCEWYRAVMKHINQKEWDSENVLHVEYETFVTHFDEEKGKLDKFLEIDEDVVTSADMEKSAFNARKYQHLLTEEENEFISSRLPEYLSEVE